MFDMMQDVPFDRYLFMYHILPYGMGHGVEHKNSTSIVLGPAYNAAHKDHFHFDLGGGDVCS